MALQLKRQGITRVRPLHGGLTLWMGREFPTTALLVDTATPSAQTAPPVS